MIFQSTRPVRGATVGKHLDLFEIYISIHAPRAGRDGVVRDRSPADDISIHAPRAGRDYADVSGHFSNAISIHAPRAGRDQRKRVCGLYRDHFNPRAPCGARRYCANPVSCAGSFQSTRPVRGATGGGPGGARQGRISIHAPRAGRDFNHNASREGSNHFNPRAPCGARPEPPQRPAAPPYFNPRAPCGARRAFPGGLVIHSLFQSTRAPCGARLPPSTRSLTRRLFQSTRPVRGATFVGAASALCLAISIHAPRAGRDKWPVSWLPWNHNFNPRAPCGARRAPSSDWRWRLLFQSTRPVRGATVSRARFVLDTAYFNPRAPCGARPSSGKVIKCLQVFQSTRPVRGATTSQWFAVLYLSDFNPRAPCGARLYSFTTTAPTMTFQSTRPVRGATSGICRSTVRLSPYFNPRAPCGARLITT